MIKLVENIYTLILRLKQLFGMLQVEAYTHSIPYPGLRSPSDGSPKLVTLGHITFGLYFVEKLSKASSIFVFLSEVSLSCGTI